MKSVLIKMNTITGRITPMRAMCAGFFVYTLGVILFLPASAAVVAQDSDPNLAAHGRDLFERRCGGCHSLDNDKEGPRLRGVYGRKAGTVPSFKYSDALKKANLTWDEVSLDKWLTGPDQFISDVDMDFHLQKPEERTAVIAYLKQLSGK
jgi:cytochrome c